MEIKIFDSVDKLNDFAAEQVRRTIENKPNAVLGLATGSSPVGMYKKLAELNKEGKMDFSKVTSVNLDEYIGLDGDHPQSYRYFMNDNLFDHINIDKKNTFVPSGIEKDPQKACDEYDEILRKVGRTDLQVLGVGPDGHLGFNEPGETLVANTHVDNLTESTIDANTRFFNDKSEVPTTAITMGMGTIMKSRFIILIATGEAKREAISKLKDNKIDPKCPITFLKMHPNAIILVDEAAYGK